MNFQHNLSGSVCTPSSEAALYRPKRDRYMDVMRGALLLVMSIDHLPLLLPGIFLSDFFFEAFGYCSAAEGFVFIAGYCGAYSLDIIVRQSGKGEMWKKAIRRACTIYLYYILSIIFTLLIVRAAGPGMIAWGSWKSLFDAPMDLAIARALLLLQQPRFHEVLILYVGFSLTSPLVVELVHKGRVLHLIAASLVLWSLDNFGARDFILSFFFLREERFTLECLVCCLGNRSICVGQFLVAAKRQALSFRNGAR